MASVECRKKAGVPVLARVAAILRPMIPDLPTPVTITRPRHCLMRSTARRNDSFRRGSSARIAFASISRILRASVRSAMNLLALCDGVEGHQAPQQRLEPIESKRILRIALCHGWIIVDLE